MSSSPAKPVQPGALLWAGCGLALCLILGKAFSGEMPWWPHLPARLLVLVASSWSDIIFALSCGFAGELFVRSLARTARGAVIARWAILILFAAFVVYAVAAVGLFNYFRRPLTFYMFGMVGNATAIRSSLAERITPAILLAFVCAPALFLLFATRTRPRVRPALALAVVWIVTGWLVQRSGWQHKKLQYLHLNPHAELARTFLRSKLGAQRPEFARDFPPEYLNEFRPFRTRSGVPSSPFELPPGTARPRNTIVIVMESVGTNYLHLYGHSAEHMPTLTAEARHALVFENIYAHASFTFASFRPLNFSVYPGLPWHWSLLLDDRPFPSTLATKMKQTQGARTAYFTSGDLFWYDQRWLLERKPSFDLILGAPDLGCPVLSSWGTEDRCAFDRLIAFVEEDSAQPFLAVCWTDQTHDPYLLGSAKRPPSAAGASPNDFQRYLALIENTDAQLARLFAALRARGVADDTLVVITGDHGETFGESHGQRGHAWSVYEEEVKVPLVIWNPRLFPNGGRVRTLGGHVDINPTLADLLGVEPGPEWQGYSLFDPARPPRTYFLAIGGGNVFGVREGDWKYAYDVSSGSETLFNLATDPQELHDLSAQETERARGLRQRVAAWVTFEEAFLWGREN